MKTHSNRALIVACLLGIIGAVVWVIAGIPDTFDPKDQPIGYVGQPAFSSGNLYTGANAANRTRIYAIDYDGTDWSGNLHSYQVTASGAIVKADDWGSGGTAANIDVQDPVATAGTARKIITRDGNTTIQFRWKSAAGVTSWLLNAPSGTRTNQQVLFGTDGEKKLNYIRGARSDESPHGRNWRTRSSALGDIIHSTPVYCAAAACTAATIFVGANDGMLHAINAVDGSERFAYIPSMLLPNLPDLTNLPYTHEYFVDGRMDLRKFGSQTILVGALGSGGPGLFGLDVTNAAPASEAAATSGIVLWEISNTTTNFANLGYTYGQPVLATLRDGTNAVVVGNGYGNSGNYKASLYLINATTGALIRELVTTDDIPKSTDRNGLSSPILVDVEGDGKVDFAYAGDLNGNLWKFDLASYSVTKLFTTDPAQPITMAPGLVEHPKGGFMVTFVTGRMLLPDDANDTSTHYAYGIWDGAPAINTTLLTQTLTEQNYTTVTPNVRVRTATANVPDWTAGHHRGWKTALPIGGERVVGDGAYVADSVFIFMSTNPTITATPPSPDGGNWWMQLSAYTGGDNNAIRFDLDNNDSFTPADKVTVSGIATSPVGRNMGGGRRSQLSAISAGTFVAYQSNYDKNSGESTPQDRGISGGHFDYDIYYWSAAGTISVPTTVTEQRGPFCLKTTDVNNQLNEIAPSYCKTGSPYMFPANYIFMTDIDTQAKCGDPKQPTYQQWITCATVTYQTVGANYADRKHVHEYDDIYDVTGVNMLHPSEPLFKVNTMKFYVDNPNRQFKILVMNQFLNPAVKLAIGPNAGEESVKTYGALASQADATALLAGLQTYTAPNIGTFLFNLPKTAFQSKDWWGSGGDGQDRAGLQPTQTGCVKDVGTGGQSDNSVPSPPGGVRSNGAFTIQIIDKDTPAGAIEMNYALNGTPDVRYGWRVKQSEFSKWVLGEYTAFWHHPNGKCYGQTGWVQNPPQDPNANTGTPATGASDAADPKGVFGGPGTGDGDPTIVKQVTNPDGSVTTTYSDGTVVTVYPDGRISTTSDGVTTWIIPGIDTGGVVDLKGGIDPGVIAPGDPPGRIGWRELRR